MVANVLSTLKALHYGGDRRNFTFTKYCTAHVDQDNCHAALDKWDVAPLEERAKIHYFQDGISDPSLATVKTMILVDHTRFEDFDSVMRVYVNFKRAQKPEAPAQQVCNVSKVVEVVGRAVEDVEEADEVDQVAALMEVYPKRRSTR
jgi:hypothetical protein